MVGGLQNLAKDNVRPAFIYNSAVKISESDVLGESVDNPGCNCLISDDSPFFLALVDGLELLPHVGVVNCNP